MFEYLVWILTLAVLPIIYFAKKGVTKADLLTMIMLFVMGVMWDYVAFNVIDCYDHVPENIIGIFLWGMPIEEYVFCVVICPSFYATYKLIFEFFQKVLKT